jgi:hypothetical protein
MTLAQAGDVDALADTLIALSAADAVAGRSRVSRQVGAVMTVLGPGLLLGSSMRNERVQEPGAVDVAGQPYFGDGTLRVLPHAGVSLPFEGDRMLSTILSKAILLANDTAITDASIVSQIRPT